MAKSKTPRAGRTEAVKLIAGGADPVELAKMAMVSDQPLIVIHSTAAYFATALCAIGTPFEEAFEEARAFVAKAEAVIAAHRGEAGHA